MVGRVDEIVLTGLVYDKREMKMFFFFSFLLLLMKLSDVVERGSCFVYVFFF
jgi:hypothetical protein